METAGVTMARGKGIARDAYRADLKDYNNLIVTMIMLQ